MFIFSDRFTEGKDCRSRENVGRGTGGGQRSRGPGGGWRWIPMGAVSLEAVSWASGRNSALQTGSPRHPGCSSCFLCFCKSVQRALASRARRKELELCQDCSSVVCAFRFWAEWLAESTPLLLPPLPPPPLMEIHITSE